MSKNRILRQRPGIGEPSLKLDNDSLLNHSRQELIELANNLLNGKYEKNSRQRDKIMQQLVKLLSELDTPKRTS